MEKIQRGERNSNCRSTWKMNSNCYCTFNWWTFVFKIFNFQIYLRSRAFFFLWKDGSSSSISHKSKQVLRFEIMISHMKNIALINCARFSSNKIKMLKNKFLMHLSFNRYSLIAWQTNIITKKLPNLIASQLDQNLQFELFLKLNWKNHFWQTWLVLVLLVHCFHKDKNIIINHMTWENIQYEQ